MSPNWWRPAASRLPDVELILKEMVSGDQLKRLGAGEIDIGLLRPPIPRSGLQFFRVKAEPMIAAVPAGHRLAGADDDRPDGPRGRTVHHVRAL